MGKILQIQVRAYTYNEQEVLKAYPQICLLVWHEYAKNTDLDQHLKHGLFELVEKLENEFNFASWNRTLKDDAKPYVEKIVQVKEELEEALANWNPSLANKLSVDLEDLLAELEKIIIKFIKE